LEELRGEQTRFSVKQVARLTRQERLQGVSRRPGIKTTRRAVDAAPTADLVGRDFTATAPNQRVADITFVPTGAGFLYLAVVLEQRQPQGVIHHSDHGCQGRFKGSSQHGLSEWRVYGR